MRGTVPGTGDIGEIEMILGKLTSNGEDII